jgi:hypothetical protein
VRDASFFVLVAVSPLVSRAATLQVGPTRPYLTVRAAAEAAQAGDLVEVDAGVYPADVATWSQPNVTVGILEIYAVNNTLVNDKSGGVTFVRLRSGSVLRATNNLLYGSGTSWSGGTTTANANYIHPTKDGAPGFQNSAAYDYRLTASSPSGAGGITDAGVAPGVSSTGYDLTPRFQYVYDAQASTRPPAGPFDVGAFELSGATSSDPQARMLGFVLYPNPATEGGTTLVLEVPVRQHVRLGVYDVRGRLVALLRHGDMDAGRVQVLWDGMDTRGRRVAAGRYVCQLEAGERVIRRSVQFLR